MLAQVILSRPQGHCLLSKLVRTVVACAALAQRGQRPAVKPFGCVLVQIDVDGDGQISLSEFKGLVKTLEKERGGLRPKGYEPRLAVATHGKPKLAKSAGATDQNNSSLGLSLALAFQSAASPSCYTHHDHDYTSKPCLPHSPHPVCVRALVQ